MMSSCMNRIEDDIVRSIITNLTFVGFEWMDSFHDLFKIDYSKYRQGAGNPDLELTPEQHMMFYKLENARTEFLVASKARAAEQSKTISIFGINLNKVSESFKFFYIVGIFSAVILGLLYMLGKVSKSEKEKKIKKNKKTETKSN